MNSRAAKALALLLVCLTAACSNNSGFKKASPAVTASTNMQLAIEYLRLGKLAAARDFIEQALTRATGKHQGTRNGTGADSDLAAGQRVGHA